ncbi:MAG TPA: Nif3-like dinuclear metal center hexameric protein [Candidatus Solibacter sp.]|nr:Nif3-like dinuclear metal center hexameric protein [Candidatus Solibacter sp.]
MGELTRRSWLQAAPALLAGGAAMAQPGAELTARQAIERIRKNVGVPWRSQTVDTFKAGNPDAPVKGIATTVMATFDVLQRAARSGQNLVITHEPTFYNHEDDTKDFAGDPVYAAKHAFIEKNNMVVWRFHDHWHARRPDGILTGMLEILGWEKFQDSGNPRVLVLPSTPLASLARDMQKRLKVRTMRVIGDPAMPVSKVALNPGYASLQGATRTLARPEVEVLVVGELREWEGVEYAQDAIALGMKKALIVLGHAISEENGMSECARWLKTFVTEVPVEFVPAGEPFWPVA